MSDSEEQKICQACSDFEPQTWRKSLCKNCFHTLEEHSAEILANEASAVAKEKAETKASEKDTEASPGQAGVKPGSKKVDDSSAPEGTIVTGKDDIKQPEVKESEAGTVKRKYGAARCPGGADGAWSWAKDLGREFSKTATSVSPEKSKETKVSPTVSSTGTATSAKSSPPTSVKPSVKSATGSTIEATSEKPSPLSLSSVTTTTCAVTTETAPASVSKAKSFASKFESKATALSKSKSQSKPPDIRPGSASVAALTGKLTDSASGSRTKSKLPPEKLDEPQKLPKKPDSTTVEGVKTTETKTKLQTAESVKAKVEASAEGHKDSKLSSDSSKDKLSEKTSKFLVGGHSKAAPFGKDILRSTKDSLKRDNIPIDPTDKKSVSPQTKDEEIRKTTDKSRSVKSVSEKCSDNKSKKPDSELATTPAAKTDSSQNSRTNANNTTGSSSSAPPDSKRAAAGTICNNRQLAKTTGRNVEGKLENSETPDHTGVSEDSEGDVSEDRSNKAETCVSPPEPEAASTECAVNKEIIEDDKKHESATSVSSTVPSREETPPSFTSVALKPTHSEAPSIDSSSSSLTLQSEATEINQPTDIHYDDSHKDSTSIQSPSGRAEDLDEESNEKSEKVNSVSSSKSAPSSSPQAEFDNNVESSDKQEVNESDGNAFDTKDNIESLNEQLKEKDETLSALNKQLSRMEEQIKLLEEDRDRLQKESLQTQKDDLEKLLQDLRSQLSKMEEQCSRLDKDNQALLDKLRLQEASVKRDQENRGKTSDNVVLEEDLEAAEQELEEVKEENKELQRHIMEMKNEMDEMHDHFREHDHDEFREIQKELDMTAKNCRILQFKLRKAERRNDQIEQDRIQYEEKLRRLQDQFDSQDAKDHIRLLEEELRMAKEVSVRLHDELDVVEDKRNKALEENKHLTELLEHTDKRQFRLEMEIDKLRDIVADLKQQLKEAKAGNNNNNKDSTPDRKVLSSIYTRSID
ncbi:hypothetical protein BsWGS_14081 [Bradybaena similaris]